jgi:electron transfer flavoprotein alpha subunit
MTILLFAEHDNATLSSHTAKALSAAKQIGGDVHVLVAGSDCGSVATEAAQLEGVARVLLADDAAYAHGLAEPLTELILSLAKGYRTILSAATVIGKTVMPRVAARLDVMQVSEVLAVLSPDTFERPIYAGNAIQTVQTTDDVQVLTVRTTAFTATGAGPAAVIEPVEKPATPGLSRFVSAAFKSSDLPELSSAKVVISGGRGLGSEANFNELILPLASKLGAAIGASRAAVDSGYAPNDWQVGQTGKVVAPEVYIAVGISGAIQHLAGMKDARIIVAINKDEDAPIFQIADYGLVADLFKAVPELTEAF